jgi:hypothetical protein
MVMHSRLLPEVDALAAPAQALNGKQLWVSHGLQDGVIPHRQRPRHPRSCEHAARRPDLQRVPRRA